MSRPTRKNGTSRLNLATTTQTRERLEDLQRRTQASSLEEVVRRALAYYDVLVGIEESGGAVVVERSGGAREVLRLLP